MSIDTSGSVPPSGTDTADAAPPPEGSADSNAMDISTPEKKADEGVTDTGGVENGSGAPTATETSAEDTNTTDASPPEMQAEEPESGLNGAGGATAASTTGQDDAPTATEDTTADNAVSNGQSAAAPAAMDAPSAAARDTNGVPLADDTMDGSELRPAKKQKLDMDVSSDVSENTAPNPSREENVAASAEPLTNGIDTSATPTGFPDSSAAPSPSASASDNAETNGSSIIHPSIAEIIKLEEIPPEVLPLESLTLREMAELESSLQIGDTYAYDDDEDWCPDWGGNLHLFNKEVLVNKGYLAANPNAKPVRIKYCDWVASHAPGSNGLRGMELLLRFVYNMTDTPDAAKLILAYALQRPAESVEQRLEFIIDATKRTSYDPVVLQQDGWSIKKAEKPEDGECFHIGRRIQWQRHEAIVVAFTPDETYGGLWKAVYVEDRETFDLEPGELQNAIKKWDNKLRAQAKKRAARPVLEKAGSTRFAATANFTVDGIEHGIILAASPSRAAQGVMWPARVRHVTEGAVTAAGNLRRNSSKNIVEVVFLAPFWNAPSSPSKLADAQDPYSLGPLFEFDNIDVSEYNIQHYPFDAVSVEKVRDSFRFLGLPNAVFARYLDSHRLAVALKSYAKKHIDIEHRSDDQITASASLTESHALSVRVPIFPHVALNVPFDFILSKLPHPSELASTTMTDTDDDEFEPTINIDAIISSMTPPDCFGKKRSSGGEDEAVEFLTPEYNKALILSPDPRFTPSSSQSTEIEDEDSLWSLDKFTSDFLCGLLLQSQASGDSFGLGQIPYLGRLLTNLILDVRQLAKSFKEYEAGKKKAKLKHMLCQCLMTKGHGEEAIAGTPFPAGVSKTTVATEWRKACERIYKRAVGKLSFAGVGNNVTSVLTDSRCNGHITQAGSFERPVRLPAAIKGAKRAGAGSDPNTLLITSVEDQYLEVAENVVIPKTHKSSYIKRLRAKVAAIPPNESGVPLTDDSEGEGGEDTMGSRGSYTAAVIGVAACLKATDMVVGGQCVNAFCAVRPPGHHAGQELRSMNAISNGFCLFNGAACAAMYATTPLSQGGLGMKRVCIIDFDVHHGNGTQDCLCPTYDPRYLYVSLHAGGAHINGYDEDSEDESFRLRIGHGKKEDGIFPGRCGDSSPHEGVLNIPLGKKVTASAVGAALVSQVTPKVEGFAPDLIILSAGFDAHVNDPLGMGGLTAEDFKSVTEVACNLAFKVCSGRIFSVLEGGYGVPCCQPRDDLFLPTNHNPEERYLNLGSDMPANMTDEVPFTLKQKLDKCHAEGFLECVKEHVTGFVKCNKRK
ncbi:hypothetical protein ACHAXT_006184 [Thalassiosira profunda]